ncbi:hypothetical protein IUS38_24375 [Mycobacteroides abscessus subsp. abscessus]|uniref:hypothetical protein n=1 Tax=Mycobacteroides abscessus TaxID=36809 RepID=UPI0019D085BF|nr:hypothetical protein [Mycobacteroides abscessus]MBN7438726.1 hypothetical protein [Mycobacteroides abscessus subsp. abscessus]
MLAVPFVAGVDSIVVREFLRVVVLIFTVFVVPVLVTGIVRESTALPPDVHPVAVISIAVVAGKGGAAPVIPRPVIAPPVIAPPVIAPPVIAQRVVAVAVVSGQVIDVPSPRRDIDNVGRKVKAGADKIHNAGGKIDT